jgi:hypothetical protein
MPCAVHCVWYVVPAEVKFPQIAHVFVGDWPATPAIPSCMHGLHSKKGLADGAWHMHHAEGAHIHISDRRPKQQLNRRASGNGPSLSTLLQEARQPC